MKVLHSLDDFDAAMEKKLKGISIRSFITDHDEDLGGAFSLEKLEFEGGGVLDFHSHPEAEVIIVKSGQLKISVKKPDGGTISKTSVFSNDVIIIAPNESHRLENNWLKKQTTVFCFSSKVCQ